MKILALHPGITAAQVQENTGFPLVAGPNMAVTEHPTERELECLRRLDPERLYTA